MDFFNNIGKAFTGMAKTVQQKTASGIESGKLSGEIRTQKAERAKLVQALGEAYFETRNGGDTAEQLALICRRIEEIDEKIAALSLQLDVLNGQKRCPNCQKAVSLEVKFCPVCGTPVPTPEIPKEPEPETKTDSVAQPDTEAQPRVEYCARCGAMRQEDGKFCVVCGAPFDAPAEEKPEVEINWPEAEKDPAEGDAPKPEE